MTDRRIVLTMLVALAACGDDAAEDDVEDTLVIEPSPTFVTIGLTRPLTVEGLTGIDTTWTSSDPSIVAVTAGTIAGVAVGEATIEVRDNGMRGHVDVTVYPELTEEPGNPTLAVTNHASCALADDGRAICWGSNLYNVAGHAPYGDVGPVPPEPVADDHAFTSITIGGEFACGLTAGGEIWCWGTNFDGVLGVGPNPPTPPSGEELGWRPLRVDSDETFVTVTAGLSHACALNEAGKTFCWGSNLITQLDTNDAPDECGTPPTVFRQCARSPIAAAVDYTFVAISAREDRTCGLTAKRTFYCWGEFDTHEQDQADAAPWRDLAMGSYHRCAIAEGGEAWCWGADLAGELGSVGPRDDCDGLGLLPHDCLWAPHAVDGGHAFASLSTGTLRTCGVTTGGEGYCWGTNGDGALGDGTELPADVPRLVAGGHTFARIVTDAYHSCGVTTAGDLYCWGDPDGLEPTQIDGFTFAAD